MFVFLEFVSIVTHLPIFITLILFIQRIRCRGTYLLAFVLGFIFSVSYHSCKMIGRDTCIYSFAFHLLLDHNGSEAMVLATSIIMTHFRWEYVRQMFYLSLIVATLFYKLEVDNVLFSGFWSVFFFTLSIPRMYSFREFHFGVVCGIAGLACFYSEPAGGNILLHSFWHFFSIMSSVFFNLASARLPCDDHTCTCEVRKPGRFWTASVAELFGCVTPSHHNTLSAKNNQAYPDLRKQAPQSGGKISITDTPFSGVYHFNGN